MPLFLAATLIMVVSIHHLQPAEKRNATICSNEERRKEIFFLWKKCKELEGLIQLA